MCGGIATFSVVAERPTGTLASGSVSFAGEEPELLHDVTERAARTVMRKRATSIGDSVRSETGRRSTAALAATAGIADARGVLATDGDAVALAAELRAERRLRVTGHRAELRLLVAEALEDALAVLADALGIPGVASLPARLVPAVRLGVPARIARAAGVGDAAVANGAGAASGGGAAARPRATGGSRASLALPEVPLELAPLSAVLLLHAASIVKPAATRPRVMESFRVVISWGVGWPPEPPPLH